MKPSEITITHHAKQRLRVRFGINNHHVACNWISQKMEHARYLGITVDKDGKEARMYASKGVVIHFATDTNSVLTVYKEKGVSETANRRLLIDAYEVVKKDAERVISHYDTFSAELVEELRWLNEEIKRTRSRAKRLALQARINAVQMRVDELPTEALEIKRQVTRYAKGVAAYV
ncbi:hypothetical protein [Bacillus sp. Bos-x628]|uniref:hypothetical protein n=1 Tax=Bacillus maqinnsis TaxID=3229854 RepID=UPI0033900756